MNRVAGAARLLAMAGAFLAAPQLHAQPAPGPATQDDSVIIVTGTRLRRPNDEAPSPTQVVPREDFDLAPVPNVEQLLNQLPQLVGGFTTTSNNPGTGGATLDLRGLGSVRTLILVNGRRWIASDAGQVPEVDVNTIPAALIERVDIVTGGASAVYGADAVTGVVNFVLRDAFEGVALDARQSITDRGDGRVSSADLIFGTEAFGGRLKLLGALGWLDQDDVLQGDREFSQVTLNDGCAVPGTRGANGASRPVNDPLCAPPNAIALIAGGSAIVPGSHIFGPAFFPVAGSDRLVRNPQGVRFDPDGTPRPFVYATDAFNFAPANYLQIPFERFSAILLGNFEAAAAAELYTELAYVRTTSTQQLAPVPAILGGGGRAVPLARINLANPFLTPAAARVLELSYGVDAGGRRGFVGSLASGFRVNPAFTGDADGIVALFAPIGTRLDLGPRQVRNERDAYRALLGLRGELGARWSYDFYASHSRVDHLAAYTNGGSATRLQQALLAIRDPATGTIRCLDPSGGCAPANIFGAGNLSPAAADFIRTQPRDVTAVEEQVAEAIVRGEFALLPAGPAGLAAGLSWRRTAYDFRPDPSLFTGDELGFQPGTPASGATRLFDLFAEVRIPLLREQPFAQSLTVELGARRSHHDPAGSDWTWKALATWEPVRNLRLRGGYQRAVRAPNVRELFEAPSTAAGASGDPCSIPQITTDNPGIVAACIRNGVPPDQVGQELFSFPIVNRRGNPDLDPEVADTWTIGAVLTLPGNPRLSLSLDHYDIRIDGAIGPFGGGGDFLVFGCIAAGGDPADPLCQAFDRGSEGDIVSIDIPTANQGLLVARGFDWQFDARVDLGTDGAGRDHRLDLRLAGTHYLKNGFRLTGSVPFISCAGRFGGACGNTIAGTATPEWKLFNNLTWTAGAASLNLRHRWFSATEDYRSGFRDAFGLPPARLPEEGRILEGRHYLDLTAGFRFGQAHRLTFGVANLTDERPAVTGALQVQANTDPSLYDVLGRRWFVSLSFTLP